jgi:type IV secretion system protein VirB9
LTRPALALVALLMALAPAEAADVPRPGVLDPRIQTIQYDPDQVVLLRGTMGYQFMLEFAPDEKIETVSIGDSLGWQVTPNRKADVLFIKPIFHSATNLTVITAERRYAFELQVAPPKQRVPVLYVARMIYPTPVAVIPIETAPQVEPPPVVANNNYNIKGSSLNRPVRAKIWSTMWCAALTSSLNNWRSASYCGKARKRSQSITMAFGLPG